MKRVNSAPKSGWIGFLKSLLQLRIVENLAQAGAFSAQYPAIDLEISVDQALTDIVAGRFDAGIRPGERVERDMIAVRLGEEMRGVIVAAPDYLARHPRPTTPRDLEMHSCIRFRFPSGVIVPWHFEKKGKQVEVAARLSVGLALILAGPYVRNAGISRHDGLAGWGGGIRTSAY
jgi:DNA-binding transcriptional LysR family regulator